jgi:CrcB protein
MFKLMFIALGGAAGTLLRYVVSGISYRFSDGVFPLGTLIVNLSGAFIIGFLWGLFEESNMPSSFRAPIFIGIIGGYTTFSTFALESFNLMRGGEYKIALINILASNIFGIGLVFVGFILAKLFIINIKGAI